MTGSLSPEQRQLLMAGYALYDLSGEEAATLEALLAEHPDLWDDLDQLQATWEMVCDIAPQNPPNHLRATVLQAAALSTGTPQPVTDSEQASSRQLAFGPEPAPSSVVVGPWWRRGLGAAAAVLIVGLSLSNVMLWRALQMAQQVQTPGDTLTVALADPATSAIAQVQINPQTLEGALTVENLPPLEPGMVYVLWTVVDPNAPVTVDDKNAILTTVFTVDEAGRQSQPIDLPSVYRRDRDLVRAVAITQESAEAPQAHLSAPILIQPL